MLTLYSRDLNQGKINNLLVKVATGQRATIEIKRLPDSFIGYYESIGAAIYQVMDYQSGCGKRLFS